MTLALNWTAGLKGQGSYSADSAISSLKDNLGLGQNGFHAPDVAYVTGSGSVLTAAGGVQVNDWFHDQLTIPAGATVSIDLNGPTFKNPFGTPLAFTSVRYALVAIDAPDGVNYVVVGPQGVLNAAQLWAAGVGADAGTKVYWHNHWPSPVAGWPVVPATADLLPIKNPGASDVLVNVLVIGVK